MTSQEQLDKMLLSPSIEFTIGLKMGLEITQTHPSVEVAYHYTDINGFLGIVNNRELWLSNVNFMNDRAELNDGINAFRKEFAHYLRTGLTKKLCEFKLYK